METGPEVLVETDLLTASFQPAKPITTAGGVPSGRKGPATPAHALCRPGGLSALHLCLQTARELPGVTEGGACPASGVLFRRERVRLKGMGEVGQRNRPMGRQTALG